MPSTLKTTPKRILGIDTGLAIAGWSILEVQQGVPKIIAAGAITTEYQTSGPTRLAILYDSLIQIIEEFSPTSMAVEDLFFFKNQKTIIQIGQARGVILLAGNKKGLPIFNYTPLQVKMAVSGYGRATKSQVQSMVQKIFNLKEVPKPDDVADAIAIAYCHSNGV